jgi:hypothetical protein
VLEASPAVGPPDSEAASSESNATESLSEPASR